MTPIWLHLSGTTYATWLRGDPRSFRSRNHRDHAQGDSKNPPPPGTYDALHRHAKSLLKRPPVRLSIPARRVACETLVEALEFHGSRVRAACVDDHHFHVLARIPIDHPTPQPAPMPTGSSLWASSHPARPNPPKRKDADTLKATARHLIGIAKAHSARALSEQRLVPTGGVWTKRTSITRVRGLDHFFTVERYILNHAKRGAATHRHSTPK